jgi:hypothetical protein
MICCASKDLSRPCRGRRPRVTSCLTTLLGFDIRVAGEAAASLWSKKRRDEFLLDPGVPVPLSVDPMVWPSVFRYRGREPATELLKRVSILDAQYSDEIVWPQLEPMLDSFFGEFKGVGEGVAIAIELVSNGPLSVDQFPFLHQKKVPAAVPEDALLLGFDIADVGLTSGLCNTNYTAKERQELQDWPGKLNEHGLLRTAEEAEQFRAMADRRSPRDAPYWVYKLSRLRDSMFERHRSMRLP